MQHTVGHLLVLVPWWLTCLVGHLSGSPACAGLLQRRGFSVYVTAVERMDWLRIGPALLSLDYWQQQCTTHYYRWYLDRVRCAVETALQQCGTDQVSIPQGHQKTVTATMGEALAKQALSCMHAGAPGRAQRGGLAGAGSPSRAAGAWHEGEQSHRQLGHPGDAARATLPLCQQRHDWRRADLGQHAVAW
jgi:hypothetical protein